MYLSGPTKPKVQRPMGYICKTCNGCLNYHNSIQRKNPHAFVKGEYRILEFFETQRFYEGMPLVN